MRTKTVFFLIILFLFVTGAALCINWFAQASRAEKAVINLTEHIKAAGGQLSYDALETGGFPNEMIVTFVNPRYQGRLDPLFSQLPNPQNIPLPTWEENIALEGTVEIGINALSEHYTLKIDGSWNNTSIIDSQSISMQSTPTNVQCSLEVKRAGAWFGNMWDFTVLSEHEGKEFLNDFRLLDCAVTATEVTNRDSGNVLTRSGPQRFYISHDISGGERKIRIFLNAADMEVTQEGDKIMGLYSLAMAPYTQTAPLFSAYGKQNIDIDFNYTGPLEWDGNPRDMPIEAHLSKFLLSNDAYTMTMAFDLSNADRPDGRFSRAHLKYESTFTDIYDMLVQDIVRNVIQQLFVEPNPTPQLKAVLEKHTPSSLYSTVAPIIPNFGTLGRITAALDASYLGNKEYTQGDITLAALELSTVPYGIAGQGTATLTQGNFMPATNITLNCNNCLVMIDDVVDYVRRLQEVGKVLQPEIEQPPIDQRQVDGLKSFLRALAGNNVNGTNFTYTILSDGRAFMINDKPMHEVLRLYQQYIPKSAAPPRMPVR